MFIVKGIILIAGSAQAGKDTTAIMLKNRLNKALHINFADYLKFICEKYFNWNGIKDVDGRQILQHVGTSIVRSEDPLFWVRTVDNFIKIFKRHFDYFIVSDARFPNEIEFFENKYYDKVITIKIIRPNFDNGLTEEQKMHESETALNNFVFDYTIFNDSDLSSLNLKVDKFIEDFLK